MVLVLLVLAAAVGGCLGGDDATGETGSDDPAAEANQGLEPFVEPFTLTGCTETGVIFLVGFDQAASALPEGFEPADAAAFFGAPAPMGEAAVFLTATRCEAWTGAAGGVDEALIGITIQPPDAPGDRSDAVDLYTLGTGTSTPASVDRLERLGWERFADSISNDVQGLPVAQGSGEVLAGDDLVYRFSMIGPAQTLTFQDTYRWWHAADQGLAYVDFEIEVDAYVGTATCEIAQGSPAFRAAGATACTDPSTTAVAIEAFDTDGTWAFLGPVDLTS